MLLTLFKTNFLLLVLLILFSCPNDSNSADLTSAPLVPSITEFSSGYGIRGDFYIALVNTNVLLEQNTKYDSQARFSIEPSLPNGLSLDPINGNINGIPTVLNLPIPYTIRVIMGNEIFTTKEITLGVAPSQLWVTNTNPDKPYDLMVYVAGDASKQISDWAWGSSDETIASVSNGMVSFESSLTGGTVLITATKGSYSVVTSFRVDKVETVGPGKIITDGAKAHLSIASKTKELTLRQFEAKNLTSVTLPSNLANIGVGAFATNSLTSVTIPDSVTNIARFAFARNKLSSLVIPNKVTAIDNDAFVGNQLKSVRIGDSVEHIGSSAFRLNQLINVIIGDSVLYIGTRAFQDNQLVNVIIGNSVTNIDGYAFANNNLSTIRIPNSIRTIKIGAFKNNQLTNVVIGNGVRYIGIESFENNQLTSVVIPDSVTTLEVEAFNSNPNLVEVSLKQSLYDSLGSSGRESAFGSQVTSYIRR